MSDARPSLPRTAPDATAVAVARTALGDARAARELAQTLGLADLGTVQPSAVTQVPLLLLFDEVGLGLQVTGEGRYADRAAGRAKGKPPGKGALPGPVRAEFVSGRMGYRREHGGGAGQLVARAVGLHKTKAPLTVVDATAGLGQDAFVLAGLGCQVTLLERNPLVHAVLADGLARAALNAECADTIARMTLVPRGSSIDWLRSQAPGSVDVVYLDPMFPHRDKSASVKKEMAVFRQVVGDDDDAIALLEAALAAARYRVVVKRPRKAPAIEGPEPATRLEGKSSRYDLYPLRALPQA